MNFYRKFIANFAEIAAPLYEFLKKKNTKIEWNERAEEAFQALKAKLTSAPLLMFPNFSKTFIIKTDASLTSIGTVLEQENDVGELQPIAYASRRLNRAERNYAVIEREALAIVFALEHFKHLTYGNKIILFTDHKPLIYLNELKDSQSRIARWMISIQKYDIHFEHIPGKLNSLADMLSRSEIDDEIVACAFGTSVHPLSLETMREEQNKDEFCNKILDNIMNKIYKDDEYILNEEQIIQKRVQIGHSRFSAYRVLIPASLVPEVLKLYHDNIIGGHFSLDKTLYRIKRNFTWTTIFKDIREYVSSCEKCQRRNRNRIKAPIQAVEPPTACLTKLSLDILGPFNLTARRNKYIITYSDHFSRMTWASPLPSQEAHVIAKNYIETIYTRYGGSKYILSDRGPQLVGHIMSTLCARLGIERIKTEGYWPRSNGVSERINGKILTLLSHYCNKNYTDWDLMLPFLMQAINNTVHRSTDHTPFYIFHGFHQYDAFSDFNISENEDNLEKNELVDSIMERLEAAKAEVLDNLTNASIKNARSKDKGRKLREFDIGQEVLALDIPSYAGHNRKLNPRYTGPHTIVKRTGLTTYRIREIKRPDVVKTMHVDKLKTYFPRVYFNDLDDEGETQTPEEENVEPIITFPPEELELRQDNGDNEKQVKLIENYLVSLKEGGFLETGTEVFDDKKYYLRSVGHAPEELRIDAPDQIGSDQTKVGHNYFLRKKPFAAAIFIYTM